MTPQQLIPRAEVLASVSRAIERCPRCRGHLAGCAVCQEDRALLERLRKLPAVAATVRSEAYNLCWCNHRGTCFPCRVADLLR